MDRPRPVPCCDGEEEAEEGLKLPRGPERTEKPTTGDMVGVKLREELPPLLLGAVVGAVGRAEGRKKTEEGSVSMLMRV